MSIFKLDPIKFSELPLEPELDGTEIVPIVKDGENAAAAVEQIWQDAPSTDKHFTQAFTNTDEVLVEHNLGKRPAVTVMNSAGDEVIGDVTHVNNNELIILFSNSFTGILTCN